MENNGDVYIDLHVQPKAKRTGVRGVHDNRLKIGIREPPEDGKANRAVLVAVADLLGVSPQAVVLVSGAGSRRKRVRVTGVSADFARKRIDKRLDEPR